MPLEYGVEVVLNYSPRCADCGGSPWRPPEQRASLENAAAERAEPAQKIVALLAEDNRADVLLVKEALALYGISVDLYVVSDGEKAFEFIERAETDAQAPCPQILLLDLNLPKRHGREVLQ